MLGPLPRRTRAAELHADQSIHREQCTVAPEGLVALLRGCPSIEVLGADSVQETQNVLRTTATDVALIDTLSPSDSDMVGALRKTCAQVRILAVGIRETASEVLACAAAGIDGYVPMGRCVGRYGYRHRERSTRRIDLLAQSRRFPLSVHRLFEGGRREPVDHARASGRRFDESRLSHQGTRMALGSAALHREKSRQEHFAEASSTWRGQAVAKLRTLIGERFRRGLSSHGPENNGPVSRARLRSHPQSRGAQLQYGIHRIAKVRSRMAEGCLQRAKNSSCANPAAEELLVRRQQARYLLKIGQSSTYTAWVDLCVGYRRGAKKIVQDGNSLIRARSKLMLCNMG